MSKKKKEMKIEKKKMTRGHPMVLTNAASPSSNCSYDEPRMARMCDQPPVKTTRGSQT